VKAAFPLLAYNAREPAALRGGLGSRMALPQERRTANSTGDPGRRQSPAPARERLLRSLISLVDDLTVEREEPGLLQSTLDRVVEALELAGGVVFVSVEGRPQHAAERHLLADIGEAVSLAEAVLVEEKPLARDLRSGGRLVAAPLRAASRCLGVMVLHDPGRGESSLDADGLDVLGKQIGTGLENVRLYAELRASSTRAEVLRRITASVTAGRDLASVVPAFASELQPLVSFDRLACGFVNESGDYIEMVSHPEGTSWGLGGVLPIVGSGPGFVALNDRPVVQQDLVQDHRFLEDMKLLEEGLNSYVLLPLRSGARTIGVLAIASAAGKVFDDGTLARLQPLADAVALAFENVRLLQKTREMSITDEVTPLFNFRHFHQSLDRELKLVKRHGGLLSLLFIDLDRFKPINDTYGHLRGSRTLREVGFLIRAAVRDTDIPARYGGDEFVVILPQTDGPSALVLADKLRDLIEGHVFLQEEGIDARLGVSLGVATYPLEAASKEALIRLADKRMYEDKETRRTGR
jgi:diguanylate cyclase (GGDEF)-like protein